MLSVKEYRKKIISLKLPFLKINLLITPFFFVFSLSLISPEIKFSTSENYAEFDYSMINKFYSEKFIDSKKSSIFNLPNSYKSTMLTVSKPIIENKILIKKEYLEIDEKKLLSLLSNDWKKNFSEKKIKFVETLLPIIADQNNKIFIERGNLIELREYININKTLDSTNVDYLNSIAKKYSIKIDNKHKIDLIDELLNFVNIIPNSIVLAQAANESGWGSSRFAREYNALFGQYTYDVNNGVVPTGRESGKKHLIKSFSSIGKSVESYFVNINTHYAYEKFRKIRKEMDINDINKSIKSLTATLNMYAEDKSYVKTINSIIDTNNLSQFDLINLSFTNS